jgi:hypothetical protein
VPDFPDIHAVLCRYKLTQKLTLAGLFTAVIARAALLSATGRERPIAYIFVAPRAVSLGCRIISQTAGLLVALFEASKRSIKTVGPISESKRGHKVRAERKRLRREGGCDTLQ